MAMWPATSAKSSQPSLPCAMLPRLAIHSIFFRRTLHHLDTEYFQRAAALPYWRIMPITGTANMRT